MLSPLDQITDAKLIYQEVRNQLNYLWNLTRSLETHIRYHQGRALRTVPHSGRPGITTYEERLSLRVYDLFQGGEYLIPHFYGNLTDISKLNETEIQRLRTNFDDPINDSLQDLLSFDF